MRLVFKPDGLPPSAKPLSGQQYAEHNDNVDSIRGRVQEPHQEYHEGGRTLAEGRRRSELLLYSSEFALFLDQSMSRIELHYLNGGHSSNGGLNKQQITRVMGSRDVESGQWNELVVIDSSSSSSNSMVGGEENHLDSVDATDGDYVACDYDQVNNNSNRIILVTPNKISLMEDPVGVGINDENAAGQLFVAGLPDSLWSSNSTSASSNRGNTADRLGLALAGGFRGCIRQLSINGRRYNFRSDLDGDALDGFDVGEYSLHSSRHNVRILFPN